MVAVEKYHGTGNDFVVVDADEPIPDRRGFAMAVCDREDGLADPTGGRTGADGVLFLDVLDRGPPARVEMTLVQPDGSTAAMCGNGARCAAAWASERTGADVIDLETGAGTRRAELGADGVSVEMGAPTFEPAAVPVDAAAPLIEAEVAGLTVTAVDTGVPHAVAFVADVAAVDLETVARPVRHADVFPEGANVTLASPRADGGFDQRTFERGVEGETRACGTGAVAIVAVAHELGRAPAGEPVAVHPPGGRLRVTLGDGGAVLEGPVERVFGTELDPADYGAGRA